MSTTADRKSSEAFEKRARMSSNELLRKQAKETKSARGFHARRELARRDREVGLGPAC